MRSVDLASVATIERKGVDPRLIAPDTPYIGLEHIERGGRIIGRESVGKAALASTKFVFSKEHLLYGKLRPNLGKISRPDFSGVCSTDILPIRPGKDLDRDYLAHYLAQPALIDFAASRTSGANLPRLSPAVLATFPIPLPPLAEQRRIAAILDRADAIRAKRRQVIAHLDEAPASIFRSMFAAENADGSVVEFAMKVRTGPFGSQLLHSEFVDEGVAVLGLDNVVGNEFRWAERRFITPEKYQLLKRYAVAPGDVLISIMGTTGRCVVVPDDIPTAINTKHICAISVDRERIDPSFLRAAFLWHPACRAYLARQTKGSIMNGLNMGIIKNMPIPVPMLSQQREFADRVASLAAARASVQSAARLDDELFASIQYCAFRGEI